MSWSRCSNGNFRASPGLGGSRGSTRLASSPDTTPPVLQVVWWINTLDSRARFDAVMQQLGQEWTVEALILKDTFRPLFVDWRGVLDKAEGRLSGEITD